MKNILDRSGFPTKDRMKLKSEGRTDIHSKNWMKDSSENAPSWKNARDFTVVLIDKHGIQ